MINTAIILQTCTTALDIIFFEISIASNSEASASITKIITRQSPLAGIPKETCTIKFSQPQQQSQDIVTRWCLDPTPPTPGEQYEESEALAQPLSSYQDQ